MQETKEAQRIACLWLLTQLYRNAQLRTNKVTLEDDFNITIWTPGKTKHNTGSDGYGTYKTTTTIRQIALGQVWCGTAIQPGFLKARNHYGLVPFGQLPDDGTCFKLEENYLEALFQYLCAKAQGHKIPKGVQTSMDNLEKQFPKGQVPVFNESALGWSLPRMQVLKGFAEKAY